MAPSLWKALLLQVFLTSLSVLAERVQYCRFGHQDGEVDFCMGLTSSLNATINHHDLYIALSVRRSSALGWTAIGTGPSMAGALMFIVYGDPTSGADPVVSIRTTDGHHQPRAITQFPLPSSASGVGTDVRITYAKWQSLGGLNDSAAHKPEPHLRRHDDHDPPPPPPPSTGPTHAAVVSLTCYACDLFPGSPISATTSSQPWIWAWNDRQPFEDHPAVDAALHMHRHRAAGGGFGTFYVDMARSLGGTPPAAPGAAPEPFEAGADRLGTSDAPIGLRGWLASLVAGQRPPLLRAAHGCLMGLAFLALFPAGAALIRLTGKGTGAVPKPGTQFRRHWVVQAVATGLAWAGGAVGVVMTGRRVPSTAHQWLGAGIVLALVAQAVLGWRHHVRFLKIRRRTCLSHAHIWLGRGVVVGGWVNMMLGMLLAGRGAAMLTLAAALIVLEAVALGIFLWRTQTVTAKKQTGSGNGEAHALMPRDSSTEDYFELDMGDDDETDDTGGQESGNLQKTSSNPDYSVKPNVRIQVVEG